MSIVTLQKATLIGLTEDKAQVLDQLQALGLVHVIPLRHESQEREVALLDGVHPEQLQQAIRYLLSCPQKRKQVTTERHFSLRQVLEGVLKNRKKRLELNEQRDFLRKRIKDLEPWGSFNFPGEQGLYGQLLWFYLVPNYRMHELEGNELPWAVVHRDNRNSYVAVISREEPRSNQMPVPRTHTGSVPLEQLDAQLEDLEIELEALDAEREAFTRWLYLLQRSLAGNEDEAEREEVSRQTLDTEEVFALQGWFPAQQQDALESFARRQGLALVVEAPAEDDLPPTLLQNPDRISGGEDIVRFYQMPGYRQLGSIAGDLFLVCHLLCPDHLGCRLCASVGSGAWILLAPYGRKCHRSPSAGARGNAHSVFQLPGVRWWAATLVPLRLNSWRV